MVILSLMSLNHLFSQTKISLGFKISHS